MSRRSRLLPQPLGQATLHIRGDGYEWVALRRDGAQVDTFRARIAGTSTGNVGSDRRPRQGDVAPGFYTMVVEPTREIFAGDEVWTDGKRYRVVSTDSFPHEKQVLLNLLQ